jgi:DNA-directed RNA polymerase beta' subunit
MAIVAISTANRLSPSFSAALEYSQLTSEQIESMATLQVQTDELRDGEGKAMEAGLLDPRFGDESGAIPHKCTVCTDKYRPCPGHSGFIRLVDPIVHPSNFDRVVHVLRCICRVSLLL